MLYYTATKDLVGKAELNTFLDMCAMQIAALKPLALCSEHLASSLLEKQEKIFEAQLPEKAKSNPEMAKKIIAGKLIKWKQENVLLEQESIVLPGKTLTQLKKEIETEGNKVSLTLFERIEL